MRRRDFIKAIAGSATPWPLAVRAQQIDRVRHDGVLMPYAKGDTENETRVQALKRKLADLGWVQGRNVQFDERWTTDNMDTVRSQAASLMASNPDGQVPTRRLSQSAPETVIISHGALYRQLPRFETCKMAQRQS
jgi:putative tryptophan/tyrosine transport system substrate-binding protein